MYIYTKVYNDIYKDFYVEYYGLHPYITQLSSHTFFKIYVFMRWRSPRLTVKLCPKVIQDR